MTKQELKAIGLTDEQVDKVLAGYEGWVPKSRFDEINDAKKKALEDVAERDKQLETLKKNQGDAEALKNQIAELQKANKAAAAEYDKKVAEMKLDAAIRAGITNAQDVGIVAGLIDRSKVTIGEDGKLTGLDEQINALQKDKAFLFKPNAGGGYNPAGGSNPAKNPFAKDTFNMTEQGRLFRENPEQARALAAAAGVKI